MVFVGKLIITVRSLLGVHFSHMASLLFKELYVLPEGDVLCALLLRAGDLRCVDPASTVPASVLPPLAPSVWTGNWLVVRKTRHAMLTDGVEPLVLNRFGALSVDMLAEDYGVFVFLLCCTLKFDELEH